MDFFERVGFAPVAIHLCPASNAWLDVVPARKRQNSSLEHLIVYRCMRSRTNNRHIPHQHIEKLRNFINIGSRNMRPMRVTRKSLRVACTNESVSAATNIDRNLATLIVELL